MAFSLLKELHETCSTQGVLCHNCRKAFSEEDFDQFQMERGYCVVGGPAKYTPQLVRNTVMSQPNARQTVSLRGLEITGRLGAFLISLSVDKLFGRNNATVTVQKRASQLRQGSPTCV